MIRLEVSDQNNRHGWKGDRAKTKAALKPVQKSNGNNLVACNIKILQKRIPYNDEDADRKRWLTAENGCDNDSNDKDNSDNDEDAGRRRTDG